MQDIKLWWENIIAYISIRDNWKFWEKKRLCHNQTVAHLVRVYKTHNGWLNTDQSPFFSCFMQNMFAAFASLLSPKRDIDTTNLHFFMQQMVLQIYESCTFSLDAEQLLNINIVWHWFALELWWITVPSCGKKGVWSR